MKEEYFADDRVIIPEYIRKMSREEIQQEIDYLEKQLKLDKEKCKNMSIEEQSKYLAQREIENEQYLEQMRQERKNGW